MLTQRRVAAAPVAATVLLETTVARADATAEAAGPRPTGPDRAVPPTTSDRRPDHSVVRAYRLRTAA